MTNLFKYSAVLFSKYSKVANYLMHLRLSMSNRILSIIIIRTSEAGYSSIMEECPTGITPTYCFLLIYYKEYKWAKP